MSGMGRPASSWVLAGCEGWGLATTDPAGPPGPGPRAERGRVPQLCGEPMPAGPPREGRRPQGRAEKGVPPGGVGPAGRAPSPRTGSVRRNRGSKGRPPDTRADPGARRPPTPPSPPAPAGSMLERLTPAVSCRCSRASRRPRHGASRRPGCRARYRARPRVAGRARFALRLPQPSGVRPGPVRVLPFGDRAGARSRPRARAGHPDWHHTGAHPRLFSISVGSRGQRGTRGLILCEHNTHTVTRASRRPCTGHAGFPGGPAREACTAEGPPAGLGGQPAPHPRPVFLS